MTAINENGQVYFIFEELDLEGAWKEVEREYRLLRDQLNYMVDYPRVKKRVIKRCNVLLDVSIGLEKLMGWTT